MKERPKPDLHLHTQFICHDLWSKAYIAHISNFLLYSTFEVYFQISTFCFFCNSNFVMPFFIEANYLLYNTSLRALYTLNNIHISINSLRASLCYIHFKYICTFESSIYFIDLIILIHYGFSRTQS